MSKFQKLIEKILDGRNISYDDAEKVLVHLGFKKRIKEPENRLKLFTEIGSGVPSRVF